MDYILNPLICTIWCSKAAMNIVPGMPLCRVGRVLRAAVHAVEPARHPGHRAHQQWLVLAMGVVIVAFFVAPCATSSVTGIRAAFFTQPFYDPQHSPARTSPPAPRSRYSPTSASTASRRYPRRPTIPRRNILLATVLMCLITGVCVRGSLCRAIDLARFTAFPGRGHGVRSRGRARRRTAVSSTSVNLRCWWPPSAPAWDRNWRAARLLYGMGRDNAIPQRSSAPRSRARDTRNNVMLVGAAGAGGRIADQL